MIRQFLSFAGVGVMNSLIDAGIFALLVALTPVPPLAAHVIGFLAGASNSFVMNGTLTFGRSIGEIADRQLVIRFAATILAQFLFATAVFWTVLAITGWPIAAKLVSIALTMVLTFLLLRRVFRPAG